MAKLNDLNHRVHSRVEIGGVYLPSQLQVCGYVMITRLKRGGCAVHLPHSPARADFFHHDGMYAGNRQLPLCVPQVKYGLGSMSRDVHSCSHWLRPFKAANPPPPRILAHRQGALLVSKDRRHLLVTPCSVLCDLNHSIKKIENYLFAKFRGLG
jgi:hypothetical protein